jgi:hypothetical protein
MTLGVNVEYLVELRSAQDLAVVADLFHTRIAGKQMHQKVFRLARIIGLMCEYSMVAWTWQCSH